MTAPLIIISGPSGSGKSTVVSQLLQQTHLPLRVAVSATTRAPRTGEVDGISYHFWTKEHFESQIASGSFLEYAQVHGDHYYGTPRSEVDSYRSRGIGVILVIDVQGAAQVRQICPEAYSIFLTASLEELEHRIRKRGSETEQTIQARLQSARMELARSHEYNYRLMNQSLEETVQRLELIIAPLFRTSQEKTDVG